MNSLNNLFWGGSGVFRLRHIGHWTLWFWESLLRDRRSVGGCLAISSRARISCLLSFLHFQLLQRTAWSVYVMLTLDGVGSFMTDAFGLFQPPKLYCDWPLIRGSLWALWPPRSGCSFLRAHFFLLFFNSFCWWFCIFCIVFVNMLSFVVHTCGCAIHCLASGGLWLHSNPTKRDGGWSSVHSVQLNRKTAKGKN